MTDYDDEDDLENEEIAAEEAADEAEAAAAGSNRNFLLALGVLGGIFVLLIIGLAILFLTRGRGGTADTANIDATNQVILMANTQTAGAATRAAELLLTPSATSVPTDTLVPATATNTQVVALPTATSEGGANPAQIFTVTPNVQTRTATIAAALTQSGSVGQTQVAQLTLLASQPPLTRTAFVQTQSAQQTLLAGQPPQTQTAAARLTGTAARLPTSGFADEVGLPGLFALAVGLVVVIFLVRRLRLSTGG